MTVARAEEAEAGLGLPIAIFASAQFELAITAHTLVMAALMWFTRGLPGRVA